MSPTNQNKGAVTNVRTATQQKILGTLRNQLGAATGSQLPPRQIGATTVPLATNVRVGQIVSFNGGTQFTIKWQVPTIASNIQIDHFNVYAAGVNGNLNQLNGPYTAINSPVTFRVTTNVERVLTFYVQTVLTSGLSSPILQSATCTGNTIPGSVGLSDLADEPPGSLISFDGSGTPALIAPVAVGSLLASGGTSTEPVYETFAALNLVLGNTNLTTANNLVIVASSGEVTQLAAVNSAFLTTSVSGVPTWVALPIPIADGGTGTATPSLVAGTNVTITGSWPNQTINASGGGGGVTAAIDLTAQAANIGTSNIVATLPASAMYRITATLTVTQAATSTSSLPALTLGYTDGNSSVVISGAVTTVNSANTTTTVSQAIITAFAKTGTALTYSTSGYASSGATPMQYSLHIRVENLT